MKNHVDIYYCVLEERLSQPLYESFLIRLPEKIRTRIQKFVRWQDAQASLIGYLLIDQFVLNEKESLDSLQTNIHGKPYLIDGSFFNVTHSNQFIALAKAKFEIGIDAEMIREYDYLSFIAEFASENEKKRIINSINPLMEFYTYWTQKEACIKQLGKGLSIPLKSFEVSSNGVACFEQSKLQVLNVKTPVKKYVLNIAIPHDIFSHSMNFVLNTSFVSVWDFERY